MPSAITHHHNPRASSPPPLAPPPRWRSKYAIRRYGFHGTSHQYLVGQAAQMLGKAPEAVNVITCHLGGWGGGEQATGSLDVSL